MTPLPPVAGLGSSDVSLFPLSARTFGAVALLLMALQHPAAGQLSTAAEEPEIKHLQDAGAMEFRWRVVPGRTYFLQQSDNLRDWRWIPKIHLGDGTSRKQQFPAEFSNRGFMRYTYSDIPAADPDTFDYDGDGVPSLFELQNNFNPLSISDSIHAGLPSEWHLYHFGNLDQAPDADPDGDALDNALEFALQTDPNAQNPDYDGDGVPNGLEYTLGVNPTLADSNGDGLPDGYGLPGAVRLDHWLGIPSSVVGSLVANPDFPNAPDATSFIQNLESSRNVGDEFGSRVRGFIIPDETRDYVFYLTADDQAEFWLSSDNHAYNKVRLLQMSVAAWNQWDRYPTQTSEVVPLQAGVPYYFEVLHKENFGSDHFQVAWSEPGGSPAVVSGANLMSWQPDPEDADDDALQDSWELANGLDPGDDGSTNTTDGGAGDADADGLSNLWESQLSADPQQADSDSDGILDGIEHGYFHTSPTEPTVFTDVVESTDWTASPFGTPIPPVAYDEPATGKLHLLAAGRGIDADGSDSMGYLHRTVTGDFSVTISYDRADQAPGQFTRDGKIAMALMARESLAEDARHVAVLTQRSLKGFYFTSRTQTAGNTTRQGELGAYPAAYAKAWIRLERRGNSFSAFASPDQVIWFPMGQQSLDLPHSIYLGFALYEDSPLEYTSAVVEVSAWHTDMDQDGIWDADEAAYGTSITAADSDGDGYSDHEEVFDFFTDPTVADLSPEAITDSATGAEAVAHLGDWVVVDGATYARQGRGAVEFEMTVPQDAIYRIGLVGQSRFNQTGRNLYNVKVSVDGVYIGRIFLNDVENEAGTARILSPWIKAGTHTLKFYVDNTYTYRSLQINQVTVGYVGGEDANSDSIPDWMTNRLARLNGFDNASPGMPTQSRTSPFCLTGRSRYLAFSESTDPDQVLHPLPHFEFYTNLSLDPAAATDVTVDFENQGLSQTTSIEWVPTNIATTPEITIRIGDSLMLTAQDATTQPGDALEIDLGDGSPPVTTTVGTPVQATFAQAGTTTVTATLNGTPHPMAVTVMEADLGDRISLLVEREFNFQPAALSADAAMTIDDAVVMREVTTPGQPRKFVLTGAASEPAVLAASTPTGAVLDHVELAPFSLASNDQTHVQVIDTFPDGDRLVSTNIVIDDVPDGIRVEIRIIVGGVTFSDGSIRKYLTAADFDELGRATLYFITPEGVDLAVCHRMRVTVGGVSFGNI